MWFVATIASYRTAHVWFVQDSEMTSTNSQQFAPGMYLLKGETDMTHLGKPIVVKLKRFIVPTSYMTHVDVGAWIHDFEFGYPIPFEFLCSPILSTCEGTWIPSTVTPFVQFLTQVSAKAHKLNMQQLQQRQPVPTVVMSHVKNNSAFSNALDTIFAHYSTLLGSGCCDVQLRKAVFFGVMSFSCSDMCTDIYCSKNDCFCFLPCPIHV